MNRISLNGLWSMKSMVDNEWRDATVPGSVMNDLLVQGAIEDPFYRDNEDQAFEISLKDYVFKRQFTLDRSVLDCSNIILRCEGLDTIAQILINDQELASTDNMHRTYEFDVKGFLENGLNEIIIIFYSPVKFIEDKQSQTPLIGVDHAVEGYPHIRKAHSMFGWDWGPKIPDMGIWRDISLVAWDSGRINDVYIAQNHKQDSVIVDVHVDLGEVGKDGIVMHAILTGPSGVSQTIEVKGLKQFEDLSFVVENPELWWPNGYGDQALYVLEIETSKNGDIIDKKKYNIGLRTIEVKHEPDKWGKSFEFVINGLSIFMMGANYIPEDNLLARTSEAKTERLIQDCVEANFNMIRVWGGGYYPDNYFYDLCDRYGLVVWQDFMYACSMYKVDEEFEVNVTQEAIDNIKRIRHHASLGIWCGNNEVEEAMEYWGWPKDAKRRADYIKLFEIVLPDLVKKYDPQTFYWSSSPSSGGGFEEPRNPDVGDVHYWEVWHGQKPFTDYRNYYFRFCSEFGFQSFPALKTVESFTKPEDRNIFSRVMEKHQKNDAANGKILFYLSENFLYPKDFDSLLYTSQLLQAEAIKYGVEHWRRNRGRCMGSLYWQLNDCWPVASWSSIDYYGRWKALHYFTKKFYDPILLSVAEEGTKANIVVTNDTLNDVSGLITWKLRSNTSEILQEGTIDVKVDQLTAKSCKLLQFADILDEERKINSYLECTLYINDQEYSRTTVLFTKPKHFEFLDPQLSFVVEEQADHFSITVSSTAFTKYVELNSEVDVKFSDNYFDLSANEKRIVTISKDSMNEKISLETLVQKLSIRSVYHITN